MIPLLAVLLFASPGDDAYRRGEELMRAGQYEAAAKQYVDALVADPNHAGARAGWLRARRDISVRKGKRSDWHPWAPAGGGAYVVSLVCTLYFGLRFTLSNTECR